MVDEGHEVWLSMPEDPDNEFFAKMGCKIIPTRISRRGINPIKDLRLIRDYKKIISDVNPDIIFSFTIKPNIYGTIASNKTGHRQVCNITGTGATFQNGGLVAMICRILYRISVRKCYKTFFQNTGDRDYFIQHRMVAADRCEMLPGSGCNLEQHSFKPLPSGDHLNFIYIGRVMKLKGIDEYLECARRIKEKHPDVTAKMPRYGNRVPHYLSRRMGDKYDEVWMLELVKHCCFHKLSYRIGEKAKRRGTFYDVVIRGTAS